jgi:L,D-peptidoglycan transpeptidase YkuD (ErfK/YbiS/YcfS/YnhG family)
MHRARNRNRVTLRPTRTDTRKRRTFVVRSLSRRAIEGWLCCAGQRWPCALGRSGQKVLKREADGATPIGLWPVRNAYVRSGYGLRPRTRLPLRATRRDDGWCDAPGDRNYNRAVRLPYPVSAEEMWRQDGLYDYVVVIGYNDRPRRRGRGSAIFLHLAREAMEPTAGCIAVRRRDARRILSLLRSGDVFRIGL